jgi:ABC-type oligopeptide transport system substrate-binding subunit
MKKILLGLTIAGVFTACGKGGESATDSDSNTNINSTTPPATSDTTNPIGVMMSDTSTSISDSLNRQK